MDSASELLHSELPESFLKNKQNYRVVVQSNAITQRQKSHLEIKDNTDIRKCVAFCIDLMLNKGHPHVKLSAVASSADKAILVAELLKRKVRNLHQVAVLETLTYKQLYCPIVNEPALEQFERIKSKTILHLTISRQTPTNTKQAGYQRPLDTKLVSVRDPREFTRSVLAETKQPKKKQIMSEARNALLGYQTETEDETQAEFETGKRSARHRGNSVGRTYERFRNMSREPSVKVKEEPEKEQKEIKIDKPRVKWTEDKSEKQQLPKDDKPKETVERPHIKWNIEPENEQQKQRRPKKKKKNSEEDLDKTVYPVQVNNYKGQRGKDNTGRIRRQREKAEQESGLPQNILEGVFDDHSQNKPVVFKEPKQPKKTTSYWSKPKSSKDDIFVPKETRQVKPKTPKQPAQKQFRNRQRAHRKGSDESDQYVVKETVN